MYLQGIKTKLPSNVQPYVDKATPIIATVADLIEKAIPFLLLAYKKIVEIWEQLRPYHPELLAPAFMGLVMCFFGGEQTRSPHLLISLSLIQGPI
jgi:hypothetical protein